VPDVVQSPEPPPLPPKTHPLLHDINDVNNNNNVAVAAARDDHMDMEAIDKELGKYMDNETHKQIGNNPSASHTFLANLSAAASGHRRSLSRESSGQNLALQTAKHFAVLLGEKVTKEVSKRVRDHH